MDKPLLYHHSHQHFYRSPFGAVPVSEIVTLRLSGALLPGAHAVQLRLWRDKTGEEVISMKPMSTQNWEENAWEVSFVPDNSPGLVWYYFIVTLEHTVVYYGNNNKRLGGEGRMKWDIPNSWQITVHKKELHVPAWYLQGIIYQIFPDRFYNGLAGQKVRSPKKNSFIYGHWSDNPFYIRDPATNSILRWDFYGGNLEGIIEKLNYLKELGISILYINPIFEAASNHRYDTGDYKKIEPMLGSDKTFQQLCQLAAEMGIQVFLDGVFSHTGSDSRYFNREGNYDSQGAYHSKHSPYYPWYTFKHYPGEYDSWWGIENMPNVYEMEHSYRNFIIKDEDSVIKRWMKKGAKGWRLDVADELPTPFIREIRSAMKGTDPEAVLIGEVWEDASNKISYGERRSYLLGDELDSVMNYPFRQIMLSFFLGNMSGEDVADHLMSLYENYPKTYFYSCMNLIGSHDRARVLTLLGEAPDEKTMTLQDKTDHSLTPRQYKLAKDRLKALIGIQMTFPGVPSIYYGDEVGVEGYTDPLNRKTYPWGSEDQDLLAWTKKMTHIRLQHQAFLKGSWDILQTGYDHLAYRRMLNDEEMVIVAVNRNPKKSVVFMEKMEESCIKVFHEMVTETDISVGDEWLEIELPPLSIRILAAINVKR
nr:amylopullalanase [uncultured organism]